MTIKRTPADDAFSKCVRAAADYTCECCGRQYEESSMGLHCSHYFGRRAYSVRFDPGNAFSHCFACHQTLGSNPDDFRKWALGAIGEGRIQLLRERREDTNLAKSIRKNLKDVAKHYREELKRIKSLRAEGVTGKIEIVGYV